MFHDARKIEIYFPYKNNMLVKKKIFFQEYIEMELKILVIVVERVFRMAKKKQQ